MCLHLTKGLQKYIKQKLAEPKGETEKSKIIFGEVNTPLLVTKGTENHSECRIFAERYQLSKLTATGHSTQQKQ